MRVLKAVTKKSDISFLSINVSGGFLVWPVVENASKSMCYRMITHYSLWASENKRKRLCGRKYFAPFRLRRKLILLNKGMGVARQQSQPVSKTAVIFSVSNVNEIIFEKSPVASVSHL